MLLMPDGTEQVLVAGGKGSITDPAVSLDGQWVFYSQIHDMTVNWAGKFPKSGADIYKIHLGTRRIVRLTEQIFTPNTGAANWSSDFVSKQKDKTYLDYGVFNMGPCPLPNGRLVFTSNRDAFRPPKHNGPTLQLHVMDDDGRNVRVHRSFESGHGAASNGTERWSRRVQLDGITRRCAAACCGDSGRFIRTAPIGHRC